MSNAPKTVTEVLGLFKYSALERTSRRNGKYYFKIKDNKLGDRVTWDTQYRTLEFTYTDDVGYGSLKLTSSNTLVILARHFTNGVYPVLTTEEEVFQYMMLHDAQYLPTHEEMQQLLQYLKIIKKECKNWDTEMKNRAKARRKESADKFRKQCPGYASLKLGKPNA